MKYIVFAGEAYYPGAGVEDFIGAYDDLATALAARGDHDWGQVVTFDGTGFYLIASWYPRHLGDGWEVGEWPFDLRFDDAAEIVDYYEGKYG